jgi:hypothetical protein
VQTTNKSQKLIIKNEIKNISHFFPEIPEVIPLSYLTADRDR